MISFLVRHMSRRMRVRFLTCLILCEARHSSDLEQDINVAIELTRPDKKLSAGWFVKKETNDEA